MDKQRSFFYGFMVGFALIMLPVPSFHFWNGVINNIEAIFDYIGFSMFLIFGIQLIIDVFRSLFNKI